MPAVEMFVPVDVARRPTLCHGGWPCQGVHIMLFGRARLSGGVRLDAKL